MVNCLMPLRPTLGFTSEYCFDIASVASNSKATELLLEALYLVSVISVGGVLSTITTIEQERNLKRSYHSCRP